MSHGMHAPAPGPASRAGETGPPSLAKLLAKRHIATQRQAADPTLSDAGPPFVLCASAL